MKNHSEFNIFFICIISKQNEIGHKLYQHYIESFLYNLQHAI